MMSVLDRKNITMVNGVIGPKMGQRWSGVEEIVIDWETVYLTNVSRCTKSVFFEMREKVVHFSIPLQINASWSIGFLMVSSATYCFL